MDVQTDGVYIRTRRKYEIVFELMRVSIENQIHSRSDPPGPNASVDWNRSLPLASIAADQVVDIPWQALFALHTMLNAARRPGHFQIGLTRSTAFVKANAGVRNSKLYCVIADAEQNVRFELSPVRLERERHRAQVRRRRSESRCCADRAEQQNKLHNRPIGRMAG